MIKRGYCIYNDEYVGIESVYTVVDGKQINIPGVVELYHRLGRENKLFCQCGECGANVILVAGEKNLRRQHFRIKDKNKEATCKCENESMKTMCSKVVLKCWLDESFKLGVGSVKSAVSISALSETDRKFQLTLFVPDNNVGIVYVKNDANIMDEKIKVLNEFLDTGIVYVTDIENEVKNWQYPEYLMKMQNHQGYCLFLALGKDMNYQDAKVKVVYYQQDEYGLWNNLEVLNDKLSTLTIGEGANIFYNDRNVAGLVEEKVLAFLESQAARKKQASLRKRKERGRRAYEHYVYALKEKERRVAEREEQRIRDEIAAAKELAEAESYQKLEKVYELFKDVEQFTAQFSSRQSGGTIKVSKRVIDISAVEMKKSKMSIIVKDKNLSNYNIMVVNKGNLEDYVMRSGAPYMIIDVRALSVNEIEDALLEDYQFVRKEAENNILCDAPEWFGCNFRQENGGCGFANSACAYRKWYQ